MNIFGICTEVRSRNLGPGEAGEIPSGYNIFPAAVGFQQEFSRSSAGIQRDVPGALPELLGGDALAISRDLIVRPQTPIQVREPVHHCVHLFNVGRLVVRIPWSGAPGARPMVPTTFSPTIRSRSETQ